MAVGILGLAISIGSIIYVVWELFEKKKTKVVKDFAEKLATDIFHEVVKEEKSPELDLDRLIEELMPQQVNKLYDKIVSQTLDILKEDLRVVLRDDEHEDDYIRTISWNPNRLKTMWQRPVVQLLNLTELSTSCLKVSNLMNGTEKPTVNSKSYIVGLIHAKMAEPSKKYDIQIDWQTFDVLIRCSTKVDAETVYTKLHGWWFNRRLLIAEYISLDYFIEYLPRHASVPLGKKIAPRSSTPNT